MQEVLLVIHLLLALAIIGLVLIQRSSGGGLGIGGSGLGDFASARGAANVLGKATIICAFMFFATSLSLAIVAKHGSGKKGLLHGIEQPAALSGAGMPLEAAPLDGEVEVDELTPEPPVTTQ